MDEAAWPPHPAALDFHSPAVLLGITGHQLGILDGHTPLLMDSLTAAACSHATALLLTEGLGHFAAVTPGGWDGDSCFLAPGNRDLVADFLGHRDAGLLQDDPGREEALWVPPLGAPFPLLLVANCLFRDAILWADLEEAKRVIKF